jgi:hypothetical protein
MADEAPGSVGATTASVPDEVTVMELKHLPTGLALQPAPVTEVSSSWAVAARGGGGVT